MPCPIIIASDISPVRTFGSGTILYAVHTGVPFLLLPRHCAQGLRSHGLNLLKPHPKLLVLRAARVAIALLDARVINNVRHVVRIHRSREQLHLCLRRGEQQGSAMCFLSSGFYQGEDS